MHVKGSLRVGPHQWGAGMEWRGHEGNGGNVDEA